MARSYECIQFSVSDCQPDSVKNISCFSRWVEIKKSFFFIHQDDLVKKDFSKVLYKWDCG
jgi:uncharacterized protein YwqG